MNPEGSTCTASVPHDGVTRELRECGKPAPTHGLTLHQTGAQPQRKPICDEHFEALKITMGVQ